jgi:hypothetical protein
LGSFNGEEKTKSVVVSFLSFTPPNERSLSARASPLASSPLFARVNAVPLVAAHLAKAMTHFYVDVEDVDPYAKDSRRSQATDILRALWMFDDHRVALARLTTYVLCGVNLFFEKIMLQLLTSCCGFWVAQRRNPFVFAVWLAAYQRRCFLLG